MISTTQTTWWYGINPETNFCPKCGCSVDGNTFERDLKKFDVYYCKCGWAGHYDDFLKNSIDAKKIGRKNKIIKIENEK
jgi:hypothetical protein